MKERPILFSGEMVRAILDNRKTMTRRVLKKQPGSHESVPGQAVIAGDESARIIDCPYGMSGDRLWVKETWKPHCEGPISDEFPLGTCVKYRADGVCLKPTSWTNEQGAWCEAREKDTKWRPSIFMPRWASRITLEVTGVRVEQAQNISEREAVAEGCQYCPPVGCSPEKQTARQHFAQLWDSINSKRGFGWENNPWVWVIEFKRV